MKSRASQLLAAILLTAAGAGAQAAPSDALRQRFEPQEQWMLDALLSDEAQEKAFAADAAKAKTPAQTQEAEVRWRKKLITFAEQYHRVLETTDILPGASSVETMVSPYEFAVENYWLARQSPAKQEEFKKSIAEGDAVIGMMRGTVEKKVREGRKKAADEVEKYIESPTVRDALAYQEPAPPPSKPASATDQLHAIASKRPSRSRTDEGSAQKAGQGFSGGSGGGAPSAVDAGSAPPLPPVAAGPAGGGFTVKPPLIPIIGHDKTPKVSAAGVIIKRALPAAVGLAAGAVAGALLLGLAGGLLGALLGAVAGYLIGKLAQS